MHGTSHVSLDRPAAPSHRYCGISPAQLSLPEKNFMVSDRFSLESTASTFISLNRMGRKDWGVEKPVFHSLRGQGIYE